MGRIILTRLLQTTNSKSSSQIFRFEATVSRSSSVKKLADEFARYKDRVHISHGGNVEAARQSDVVVLSFPPDQTDKVLGEPGLAQAVKGKLIINILAGITRPQIEAHVGGSQSHGTHIVSAIPTIGAQVGESATLVAEDEGEPLPADVQNLVQGILHPLGRIIPVPSHLLDRTMAVSATTHGLMTILIDALIDGGAAAGVSRQQMLDVVGQSMRGYCALLGEGHDNADLKRSMLIPNGFTVRSILSLERKGVRSAVSDAVVETVRLTEPSHK